MNELDAFLAGKVFPGEIMFARVSGSHSHNLSKPTSDYDFGGVYAAPTERILSLNPPPDTCDNGKKKPDFAFHEVGKFCRLLVKGNPTVLEMLFTDHLFVMWNPWDELRAIRESLVSMQSVAQYVGFAASQLGRLEKGNPLHTTGGEFNEKWAYHMIRLLNDAYRLKTGAGMVVWKTGDERDLLMRIRSGGYSRDLIMEMGRDLLDRIEGAKQAIPDQPDVEGLNKWLLRTRQLLWGRSR